MNDEPDIVKELKEQEKLGMFQSKTQNTYEEFKAVDESSDDDIPNETVGFAGDDTVEGIMSDDSTFCEDGIRELFQQVVEFSPDSIVLLDLKGVIIWCNNNAATISGHSRKELVGKRFTKLGTFRSRDIPKYLKMFSSAIKGKRAEPFMVEVRHKDGTFFWAEVQISLLRKKGKIVGIQAVTRNVTERKNAEDKLRNSEEKYRDIIELSPDGIMTVNNKGVVTSCNPAFLSLTGFSKKDIVGKNALTIPTLTIKSKLKMAGILKKILKGNISETFDFEWKHKDGSIRLGNAKIGLLKKNDRLMGFQAILRDVTKDRVAQIKIKEYEERYRSLFDKSLDLIYINDFKGNFIDANQACFDLLGYGKDEIKDLNFAKLLDKGQLFKALKISKMIRKNGFQNEPAEFKLKCKNGDFVYVETLSSLIYHDGKPISIQGIARDITERKNAEEELKKKNEELNNKATELNSMNSQLTALNIELKDAHEIVQMMNNKLERKVKERTEKIEKLLTQKDEFINQLGHDLKTPLTPLVALTPLVRKHVGDKPEVIKIVDSLIKSTNHMKNMVDKTLQLAKLNSSKVEFEFEETNLVSEINDVIENNQHLFNENNIDVKNMVDEEIIVKVNKLQLYEVFTNLFTNAIKYSQDNKGNIVVDAEKGKDDDEVIVSVKDDGIGITMEQQVQIFDEFYKIDSSRHDLGSSGLGLSICKQIIEKHGGQIWVESPGIGKGCTFYFTLKKPYEGR